MEEKKKKLLREECHELERLFSERISGFAGVKGAEQARHSFIFYRDRLWRIMDIAGVRALEGK